MDDTQTGPPIDRPDHGIGVEPADRARASSWPDRYVKASTWLSLAVVGVLLPAAWTRSSARQHRELSDSGTPADMWSALSEPPTWVAATLGIGAGMATIGTFHAVRAAIDRPTLLGAVQVAVGIVTLTTVGVVLLTWGRL